MKNFQYTVNSNKSFDAAVSAVEHKTAEKGFRVLHTHDFAGTLAEKGFTREPLKLVEICNAEGLGDRRFHGRIVLLVNEHTASAGEMVAAFAEENNLATIVGTKTPGRLLSGSAFKVGHGYILGLPVAGYLTWQGRMLENNGIVPTAVADLSREALRHGRDTQMEKAVEVAKTL